MDNYKKIFKECSPDILDEIRSAVLDGTNISYFIKGCGNDSYKLGQLRMALREFVPVDYLSTALTGETIYAIRQCFAEGLDMSSLLRYITPNGILLNPKVLEQVAQAVLLGADIREVDFQEVREDVVTVIIKGLVHGYPMWLLIDELDNLSEKQINAIMRGMALGIDVHPFINGKWTDRQLILLFSYAKSLDINDLLKYINYRFNYDILKELLSAASRRVPIKRLCVKDEDGNPVYNEYQISVLVKAIEVGCKSQEIFNPSLSDLDMEDILNSELGTKVKKTKIKLSSLDD